MTKTKICTHSPFQPLKKVLLGQCIDQNFFDWVVNDKVKTPLQKIIDETNEDLGNIKKTFNDLDIEVFQHTPLKFNPLLFKNSLAIPRPPLQPRDSFLTLGDKIYCSSTEEVWQYILDIVPEDSVVNLFDSVYSKGIDFQNGEMLNGANCYRLGKRIIVPTIIDRPSREYCYNFFTNKGYEVVETNDPGHSDGVMSVVKPGVIVSYLHKKFYESTFPNWDVLTIRNQGWQKLQGWQTFKSKAKGRWWVPNEETNEYLSEFVDTWLNKWVGYVDETVFDVNMLSVSEELVLVNGYNKELFDYLKKHKVEPIICPFRHRFFWDGGIHCLTVDLVREGELIDYFN